MTTSIDNVFSVSERQSTGVAALSMVAITVTGEDAKTFFHNQWSQHVLNVGPEARLACYCTPQGRILTTPLYWEKDGVLTILVPQTLAESMVKRWRMFVLRSKVVMTVSSAPVYGVLGEEALSTLGFAPFDKMGTVGETVALRMPGVKAPLFVVVGAIQDEPTLDEGNFWLSLMEEGLMLVTGHTSGEFVPQMLNLDRVGAVSFNKGCYPGQEVVARLQYVGQTNRRVRLFKTEALLEGDDVYSAGEPVGRVAWSVRVGDTTFVAAVVSTKADLTAVAVSANGPLMTLLDDYAHLPEPNIRA